MKTLTKALVGTVAAGAMAVSAASPAAARDRGNGISTGEVIAGALVIGGIAAIAAAASDNSDRDYRYAGDYRYDRAGYGYENARYGYGDSRQAVAQCVAAAERDANRYSYGGRSDVTDIRSVRQTRSGFEVRGRIAVNGNARGYRSSAHYGSGWNGDYRGWNSNLRGYDSGTFTCRTHYGRVADLDYNGIRGL